jgi:DnaJ-class molecular chaperone
LEVREVAASTLYEVLGVAPSASEFEVHAAFLALAKKYHPDKFKLDSKRQREMTDVFAAITAAHAVLKDKARRKQYDATLQLVGKPCGTCSGKGTVTKQKTFTRTEQVKCVMCGGTGQQ